MGCWWWWWSDHEQQTYTLKESHSYAEGDHGCMKIEQVRAVAPNQGHFTQGTSGNVCRYFWLSQMGGLLMASSG